MSEKHEQGSHGDGQGTETDLDVGAVVLTAVVGFALLFTTVVWLQSIYYGAEDAQRRTVDSGTPQALAQIRAEQQAQLTGQGATLPIERAMEWVVKEAPVRRAP